MKNSHDLIILDFKMPKMDGMTVIIIAIAIFKMYDYLTTRYKKLSQIIFILKDKV
jgi:CheY-like chemotaxis protein